MGDGADESGTVAQLRANIAGVGGVTGHPGMQWDRKEIKRKLLCLLGALNHGSGRYCVRAVACACQRCDWYDTGAGR